MEAYPAVHEAYLQYIIQMQQKPANAIRLLQFCENQNIHLKWSTVSKFFEIIQGQNEEEEEINSDDEDVLLLCKPTQTARMNDDNKPSTKTNNNSIKPWLCRSSTTDSYLNDSQKTITIPSNNNSNSQSQQFESIASKIISKVFKTGEIINTKIMIDIENLDNLLWSAIDEIETSPSLSTLYCIKNQLFSSINNAISHFISCEGISILNKETKTAKENITKHYNHEISILTKRNEIDQNRVNKLQKEINEYEQKIKLLQKKSYKLKQLKQSAQVSINQRDDAQKQYKLIKNNSINALTEKSYKICSQLQNIQHNNILNETISDKISYFENCYISMCTDDIILWIKYIEHGYFDKEKYIPFLDRLEEMKVNGARFSDMNNNLFLQIIGLNQRDRAILLKHIKRVTRLKQKMMKQQIQNNNICGLCTVQLINSVMIPCGHQYCCMECSVVHNIKKCPICRKKVVQIIKTFMSGFSQTE